MYASMYSFIQTISFMSSTTQRRYRHSTDTVSEFHAKAPQTTVSEGLTQHPYLAARAGLVPPTIRMKDVESTNEPPLPIVHPSLCQFIQLSFHLLSKHLIIHSTTQPPIFHPSIHPPINSFIQANHPSILRSVHSTFHPSIHASIH